MAEEAEKLDARVVRTREKILDAGVRILFTDGWEEVTHLKLAEETSIARGTIYRHWPTIDDLLVEIFVNCPPQPPAEGRTGDLRGDLIAELEFYGHNLRTSKLGDIILNAARLAPNNEKMRLIHEATTKISRRPLCEILEAAAKKGEIRADIPDTMIGALLLGPVLYQHLFDEATGEIDIAALVDGFLEQIKIQG